MGGLAAGLFLWDIATLSGCRALTWRSSSVVLALSLLGGSSIRRIPRKSALLSYRSWSKSPLRRARSQVRTIHMQFFPKQVYLWGAILVRKKKYWTRYWARCAVLGAVLGAPGWVGRVGALGRVGREA